MAQPLHPQHGRERLEDGHGVTELRPVAPSAHQPDHLGRVGHVPDEPIGLETVHDGLDHGRGTTEVYRGREDEDVRPRELIVYPGHPVIEDAPPIVTAPSAITAVRYPVHWIEPRDGAPVLLQERCGGPAHGIRHPALVGASADDECPLHDPDIGNQLNNACPYG